MTDKLSALKYVGDAQSTWQSGAACPTAGMLISGKMVERLKLTKEPVCACKSMLKIPIIENDTVNIPQKEGRAGWRLTWPSP